MDGRVLINQDGQRGGFIGRIDMSSKSTIVGYTSTNWNKPKEFSESGKLHLQEYVRFFFVCVWGDTVDVRVLLRSPELGRVYF